MEGFLIINVNHVYAPFLGKFVDGLSIVFLDGNNSFGADEFVNFCRIITEPSHYIKGFLGEEGLVFLA